MGQTKVYSVRDVLNFAVSCPLVATDYSMCERQANIVAIYNTFIAVTVCHLRSPLVISVVSTSNNLS